MIWSAIDIGFFLLCYGIARWSVRVDPYLWFVLSANLVLSFVLADYPNLVACADLACAAPLLFRDWRSRFVGALFVPMPVVYWSSLQLGVDRFDMFAIVAVIAYAQWAVAGHAHRLPRLVADIYSRRNRNRRGRYTMVTREAETQ